MLVNQLTSLLLETVNPTISEDLTTSERVSYHLSKSIPLEGVHNELKPSLRNPNVNLYYTEGYMCVPLAILVEVSDNFQMGREVNIQDSVAMEELHKYGVYDCLMGFDAISSVLCGYNSLTNAITLGVYFHSIIRANKLSSPLLINRGTSHKLKEFRCKFKLISLFFYKWDYFELGVPPHQLQFIDSELELLEVVVKPIRGAESKKGIQKRKLKSDDEVSDVTINLGAEEIER